jgi:hypothetical protein
MTLRSDHVAGAAFIILGIVVFAISGDLPFGRLSAPGAGMLPKLMAGLMIAFAAAVIIGGAASRPFAEVDWSDRSHARRDPSASCRSRGAGRHVGSGASVRARTF